MKISMKNKNIIIYLFLIFIVIAMSIINFKIKELNSIKDIDYQKIKEKLSNFVIDNNNYEISNLYYIILNYPTQLEINCYRSIGISEILNLEYYIIHRRKFLLLNDIWCLYIYRFNERSCYFIVKFENIVTGFNFWKIKLNETTNKDNLIIMEISNLIKRFNLNIRIFPVG